MNVMRSGAAVALAGALAVSGCGAGAPATGEPPASGVAATTATTAAAPAAAGAAELQVNRSYWYAGFKVTLGAARLSAPDSGEAPVVTIEATFQNLSTRGTTAPSDDLLLTSGADSYDEPAEEQAELPEVPAQRSRRGTIAIRVDDGFDLAAAVLTVGEPRFRQAVVPLGRPDGLISLEPRPIAVRGRVFPEGRRDVFVTVTGGEVRADDADSHAQAPAGQEYVLISFTATNSGAAGMTYVFDRDLTLVLPDGSTAGDAVNCSRAQVHVQPHATVKPEGPACFAVAAPAAGAFRFVWHNKHSKGLRFTIG